MAQHLSEGMPLNQLKAFLLALARRAGILAIGWVVLYFGTQWMNTGIPALFAMVVGAVAGLVIGWYLAENAVEEAGFSGFALWIMLVAAAWATIWLPEALMGAITGWGIGGFGRWMLVSIAMLMSMAAAVWRASADD